MPRLSHSALQTYKQCQLKFRYQYIDKMPTTFDQTIYTLLGTAVHAALEFLYRQVGNHQTPEYDAVEKMMIETWNTQKISLVEAVAGDIEEQFLTRGKAYLQRYYKTYQPFNQARPWGFEVRMSYTLDADTSFSCVIDRLDAKGDTLYINDYKTNQRLNSDEGDAHVEQLTLYGLAADATYGQKFSRIVGRLIYLHIEKEYEIELTTERMQALKSMLVETVNQIKHQAAQYNGGLGDQRAFPYAIGDHCKYCPFEIVCPARKHKYADDEMVASELGARSLRNMIDEYGRLGQQIKALEEQKKSIATILEQYSNGREETRFFGDDFVLSTRNYERALYTDATVLLDKIIALSDATQYLKPHDSQILKAYKAGTLPTQIRQFVQVEKRKILQGARSRTKIGDEEEEE